LETGIRCDEIPGYVSEKLGLYHTRGSTRAVAPRSGPTQLVLEFDRDGQLGAVIAGEGLIPEAFEKFQEGMTLDFEPVGTRVARRVLFTTASVTGEWRWRDRLRIAPLPPGAPTADFLIPDFPFLFEFSYGSVRGSMANFRRRLERQEEIHLLLNGLVQPPITRPRSRSLTNSHHHWVLVGEAAKNEVRYCQEFYSFDGLGEERDHMGELDQESQLETVEPQEYHNNRVHSCIGSPLKVPSDLGDCFDAFEGLSPEEREKCLRACFWLGEANEARSLSQTFLCAVQAIESLLPSARSEEYCPECRRLVGPGPTRRFRDFMGEWSPLDVDVARCASRDELYRLRSGLAHGSRNPFLCDARTMMEITPRSVEEMNQLEAALRACRIALRNWLMRSAPKITDKCREGGSVESFSVRL
jgi:hypothetical protein